MRRPLRGVLRLLRSTTSLRLPGVLRAGRWRSTSRHSSSGRAKLPCLRIATDASSGSSWAILISCPVLVPKMAARKTAHLGVVPHPLSEGCVAQMLPALLRDMKRQPDEGMKVGHAGHPSALSRSAANTPSVTGRRPSGPRLGPARATVPDRTNRSTSVGLAREQALLKINSSSQKKRPAGHLFRCEGSVLLNDDLDAAVLRLAHIVAGLH